MVIDKEMYLLKPFSIEYQRFAIRIAPFQWVLLETTWYYVLHSTK